MRSLPLCSSSPIERMSHAGIGAMQNVARVDFAHDGELRQHVGRAIHVGAHVHQHDRRTDHGGKDAEQRGTFHARHHALHHLGGGHDGAGVAGRHEALGTPVAYQPRGHAHRAIPLGPHRLGGAVFHGDAFAGVYDLDGKIAVAFVLFQFPTDHILLAHQEDLHAQTPGGSNRPFHFGFRGVVSAHCIQRNGQHVGAGLLRNHFDNFTTLVLAAFRTNAVRKLRLVAVRTLRKTGCLQGIVRAARARPPLGVSTFGIRHISTSTNFVQLLPFGQGITIFRVPDYGARPSDRPLRAYNRTRSRSGSFRNRGRSLYRSRCTPAASATPTALAPGGCPPVPSRLRKIQFPLRRRRS